MLLYTMLLLPVVSVVLTLIIYMRFKFGQDLDRRLVTKGDKVNFILSINNEDFFIPLPQGFIVRIRHDF